VQQREVINGCLEMILSRPFVIFAVFDVSVHVVVITCV